MIELQFQTYMLLYCSDVEKLEMLQELNISGNQLKSLPDTLGELSKLVVLRAHSNSLASLPDFKKASSLRVIIFLPKLIELIIIIQIDHCCKSTM